MFCHSDVKDPKGAFLHSCSSELQELDQLRLLHRCGYLRAVVRSCVESLSVLLPGAIHRPTGCEY